MSAISPAKKTVLVVEDDDVAATGLSAILEAHDYRVIRVADARLALGELRSGLAPDVILLDMILPGCDGWHFFGAQRNEAINVQAPVIVMTGLGIASREWAVALGAADLLRKPLNVGELLEMLRLHACRCR